MSAGKPAGGDGSPDRLSGREDRPFPGAPEDRGPAPEPPRNTLSMEEVRAVLQRSSSNAEFEAAAKAHAQAQAGGFSDSPSSGAPDPGSTDERPTTAVGDGTAPGTRPGVQDGDTAGTAVAGTDVPGRQQQPEGFARPEELAQPDRELPPFPGTPENREPAPELPKNTRSMQEVRATHHRAGSNAEFEAMAEEHAAAQKEASAPGHEKDGILHGHSEFHGQKLDLYSDGTRWVSGDAVRAAQAEAAKGQADGRPEPARHDIADVPQMRELGDNTHGKSPDVHLGDTSDHRTFAEQMTGEGYLGEALKEKDDPGESKLGRAFDAAFEEGEDIHDGLGSVGDAVSDLLPRGPGPTGTHALPPGHAGYEAAPSQGLNMTDAIGGTVLMTVATVTAIRHLATHNRRDR